MTSEVSITVSGELLRGIHFSPSYLPFLSLLTQVPASIIKSISLSSATKTEFCHWSAHDPSLHPVTMFKKICFSSPSFAFQILEDFLVNTGRTTSLFSFMPFYNFFSFPWSHHKVRLLTHYLSYSSSLPLPPLIGQFPDMRSHL